MRTSGKWLLKGAAEGGTSSSIIAALYILVPQRLWLLCRHPGLPPLTSFSCSSSSFTLCLAALRPLACRPFWPNSPRVHYFPLNNVNRTMTCWLRSLNAGLINQAKTQWLTLLRRSLVFPLVLCGVSFFVYAVHLFWETKLLNQTGIAALLSYLSCSILLHGSFLTRNLWNGTLCLGQMVYF